MSVSLTKRVAKCYSEPDTLNHMSSSINGRLAKCLRSMKDALILTAEPMHQSLPCNTRTVMTTNKLPVIIEKETKDKKDTPDITGNADESSNIFHLPLLHTDWNLFVLHDAHVRQRYCSVLNGDMSSVQSSLTIHENELLLIRQRPSFFKGEYKSDNKCSCNYRSNTFLLVHSSFIVFSEITDLNNITNCFQTFFSFFYL